MCLNVLKMSYNNQSHVKEYIFQTFGLCLFGSTLQPKSLKTDSRAWMLHLCICAFTSCTAPKHCTSVTAQEYLGSPHRLCVWKLSAAALFITNTWFCFLEQICSQWQLPCFYLWIVYVSLWLTAKQFLSACICFWVSSCFFFSILALLYTNRVFLKICKYPVAILPVYLSHWSFFFQLLMTWWCLSFFWRRKTSQFLSLLTFLIVVTNHEIFGFSSTNWYFEM